ncbi:MAG: alpha-glucosidase [Chloroflexota bacterium]|nr:alpha-glucosidase [Chloroflexota bacterium]
MKDFLWWRDGVIYQIYPRSFADSNDSGIGDLNGITAHLDYLQELGIDAIWLSPINPSPDVDFGYDVSDYNAIDPKFGTMKDFEHLVAQADKRGIRIVMDLVLNHTSDQHEWFRQSRSARDNPYRDWYMWHDPDGHGQPPNNWLSVFGGKGWEWDERTRAFYYHMFYKEQPDLNWRNPKVRAAMLDVFRFWADKGVKGFRLDVFNVYFKDDQLRSNPFGHIARRPFDSQKHLYDFDQPALVDALQDIRRVLDGYDETYAVGETFFSTPEKAAGYCGEDLLHATFNFDLLESRWNAERFARLIESQMQTLGADKWPTQVLNNHDTVRTASRFGQGEDDERLKVAAALLLTLRGTPFMYYGEEIGMRDIHLKRGQILDPIGKRYWPFFVGRDGCRAPMQWDAGANAGFGDAQPWLPVNPDYPQRNVAAQTAQTDSLLNFYKQLLALRRTSAALTRGDLTVLDNLPRGVLGYRRSADTEGALVLLNFGGAEQSLTLPASPAGWQVRLSSTGRAAGALPAEIRLAGSEALILTNG